MRLREQGRKYRKRQVGWWNDTYKSLTGRASKETGIINIVFSVAKFLKRVSSQDKEFRRLISDFRAEKPSSSRSEIKGALDTESSEKDVKNRTEKLFKQRQKDWTARVKLAAVYLLSHRQAEVQCTVNDYWTNNNPPPVSDHQGEKHEAPQHGSDRSGRDYWQSIAHSFDPTREQFASVNQAISFVASHLHSVAITSTDNQMRDLATQFSSEMPSVSILSILPDGSNTPPPEDTSVLVNKFRERVVKEWEKKVSRAAEYALSTHKAPISRDFWSVVA